MFCFTRSKRTLLTVHSHFVNPILLCDYYHTFYFMYAMNTQYYYSLAIIFQSILKNEFYFYLYKCHFQHFSVLWTIFFSGVVFLLPEWFSVNISCSEGLLVIHFIQFCFSKNSLFPLNFWKIFSLDREFWVGLFFFFHYFRNITPLSFDYMTRCLLYFSSLFFHIRCVSTFPPLLTAFKIFWFWFLSL